jgi:S1-C subfamily serine protease
MKNFITLLILFPLFSFGQAKFIKKCIGDDCEYVYESNFGDDEKTIREYWEFETNEFQDISWRFVDDKGEDVRYFIENTHDGSVIAKSPVKLSNNDGNFQIKVHAEYWSGVDDQPYGVRFGISDFDTDNYVAFYVSPDDYYKVIYNIKGIEFGMKDWVKYDNDIDANFLNIVSVDKTVYFSIDGKIVHKLDKVDLKGDEVQLVVLKKQNIAFDDFKIVKQFNNGYNTNSKKRNNESSSISDSWKGNGSGFFISEKGHIVTNYHVIENANEIEVEYKYLGETITHKAEVVRSDKSNDLSIIKITDVSFQKLSSIPYNLKTRTIDVGSEVYALGYPMALSGMGSDIKFTDGRVSSKTGFNGDIRTYQTTTPIQGGNSGGPLFDYNGNLIGINSAKISSDKADNVSYSIKAMYILGLMDILPESIETPSNKTLLNKKLTDQIKIMTPYVVLIKVK